MFEWLIDISEPLNAVINAFLLIVVWRIKVNDLPHILGELKYIKGRLEKED